MSSKTMNIETIATYMASIKPATKKKGSPPLKKCILKSLTLKIVLCLFGVAFIFLTPTSIMANENLEAAKRLDLKAEKIINRAQKLEVTGELNEEESTKICEFALTYGRTEGIKTQIYKTPFHDDIALTLQNLASLYTFCHPPLAGKYLPAVLKIKEHLYGTESENAAEAHDALGDYYRFHMMEFKKAINHYQTAKQIRIKIYGPSDPRITKNYFNLATTLFFHQGNKSEAERLLLDSIKIRKNQNDKHGFPVYRAQMDAGLYDSILGDDESALRYLKTALVPAEKSSVEDECTILSELAIIYLNKNNLKTALKYSRSAYDKIKEHCKNSPCPDSIFAIEQLLELYRASKNEDLSKQLEIELKNIKDTLRNNF